MKSAWWFVAAAAVALGGFACAGFYVMSRLGDLDAVMQRTVMPGSAVLDLDQCGPYTLYSERETIVEGRFYDAALPGGRAIIA